VSDTSMARFLFFHPLRISDPLAIVPQVHTRRKTDGCNPPSSCMCMSVFVWVVSPENCQLITPVPFVLRPY
jgi:hypothetical protein